MKKDIPGAYESEITASHRCLSVIIVLLLCVLAGAACGRSTPAPSAAFSATPTSGQAPLTVTFSDTSTDATGWSWDFDNDGTADSTSQNPTYVYDTAGAYTVKLTVTGAGGTDDETKTNYITVTAPSTPEPVTLTAGFTFTPTSGDVPLTVQFTDTSIGGAVSWAWDFDNNGTTDSTLQNPQHTYNNPGSYYIKLNIENAAGTKKHMIKQITVTKLWVYDSTWWSEERLVWCYGQSLGGGDYSAVDQAGVGAVSWIDLRFLADWESEVAGIVTNCHNRDIPVVGTVSMITTYQEQTPEPAALQESILVDPFGNQISESGYDLKIHSTLHPAWKDYLIDCIERTIDLGVDGLLIDELPYGAVFEPDFNPNTMTMFRTYLTDTYTESQLNDKVNPVVVSDWSTFDYADYVEARLAEFTPAITGSLSRQQWNDHKDKEGDDRIKLNEDYDRFLRIKHKEVIASIITQVKAYAASNGRPDFSVSGNLSDLFAPESQYAIDLLDYVNLEWHYHETGYFPVGRAFASVKLAEAFGIPATVLTDIPTRDYIKDQADQQKSTNTLYKTMIADANAGGGAFHLEHNAHGVQQDMTALAPYYNFVPDNPGLFNGLTLAEDDIGLLYQWEKADVYKGRAYMGMCNLLADTGYQFETIFGAEDYTWWGGLVQYPAPPQTLAKADLDPYSLVIIPEMNDITPNHAKAVLDYVNAGGKALIFATNDHKTTLTNHRGGNPHIDTLLSKLNPGENSYGTGKIIRITDIWGLDYLPNVTEALKTNLKTKLSGEGLDPTVDIPDTTRAVSAFAYEATGKRVIHLVNYNYNAGNDTTTAVSNLELDIALGDLSETTPTIKYYTPENPDGITIVHDAVTADEVTVTVSSLDIWGVLVLENA